MSLTLRFMRLSDIAKVQVIDRAAFGMPWSAQAYFNEVTRFAYSHMVVLAEDDTEEPGLWRRLVTPLVGPAQTGPNLYGYGGFWFIAEEAHISTIAVDVDQRGKGWGELLLVAMLRRALYVNAQASVLEVRVTNTSAQALYAKYGYTMVETRAKYYRDNGEDAYYMRMELQSEAARRLIEERYAALCVARGIADHYTHAEKPSY